MSGDERQADGVLIQGLDLQDIIGFIEKKNKKFQAITLTEFEEVMDKNTAEFRAIRKITLDNYNNYTRSVIRAIFGDVEPEAKKE